MKEAKTYEELYNALNEMKTDLESDETIESVDMTLDVRKLRNLALKYSGYINGKS